MIMIMMPVQGSFVFLLLFVVCQQLVATLTENAIKTTKNSRHGTSNRTHIMIRMPSLKEDEPIKKQRYEENLEGIISLSTIPLHLHLVLPTEGFHLLDEMIIRINETANVDLELTKYDLAEFTHQLSSMAKSDFGQETEFAEMLADRMPTILLSFKFQHINRLILVENRLTVRADVSDLYAHFRHFNNDQLIGIALQQVPKYRHSFAMYEKYNPASGLGHPARPGFNTALLVLDLHKMRHSIKLNAFLHYPSLRWLVHKYWFTKEDNPVITQEDVFTLMGFEHPELFYILPCGWNRQLDLIGFSQSESREYNKCEGKICAENFQEFDGTEL